MRCQITASVMLCSPITVKSKNQIPRTKNQKSNGYAFSLLVLGIWFLEFTVCVGNLDDQKADNQTPQQNEHPGAEHQGRVTSNEHQAQGDQRPPTEGEHPDAPKLLAGVDPR